MSTFVVLIGNSDNRLTQQEWSQFVAEVRGSVALHAEEVFFDAALPGDAARQSACFVATIDDEGQKHLSRQLDHIRETYRQESIAVLSGETRFIAPKGAKRSHKT